MDDLSLLHVPTTTQTPQIILVSELRPGDVTFCPNGQFAMVEYVSPRGYLFSNYRVKTHLSNSPIELPTNASILVKQGGQ